MFSIPFIDRLEKSASVDHHIKPQMCQFIVLAPLLITGGYILLLAIEPTKILARRMLTENHVVEIGTFLILLAAGIYGLLFASRIRRQGGTAIHWLSYTVVSLGMIFVAMEEIAWGQWFFSFATPEIFSENNAQGELTLHNLIWWHDYIEALPLLLGVGGVLAIFLAPKSAFAVVAPSILLLSWFVIIALISAVDLFHEFHVFSDRLFKLINHLDEVMELLVAISALLYLWLNSRKYEIGQGVSP